MDEGRSRAGQYLIHSIIHKVLYLIHVVHFILKRSQEKRQPGSADVGWYHSKELREVMIRTYIHTCLKSERVKLHKRHEVHVPVCKHVCAM